MTCPVPFTPMINVLFICSRNQWRSPTAERVYDSKPGISVRSAGTSKSAKHTVSAQDIRWADVICVMEDVHRDRLRAAHPDLMQQTDVHVLHIEDVYHPMDPDLIAEIRAAVDPILERLMKQPSH